MYVFFVFFLDKSEALSTVELKQPFNFNSAYTDFKFTNYGLDFKACIDYIFYKTDDLRVLQVVPVSCGIDCIPTQYFPSDHVPLIADFEWIT